MATAGSVMTAPAHVTVHSPSAAPGNNDPASLVLIRAESDTAREWLEANTAGTRAGDTLACERPYAVQLLGALKTEGFSVEVEQ